MSLLFNRTCEVTFFLYRYNKHTVVSAGVCRGDTTRGIVHTFHIPREIDGMSPVCQTDNVKEVFSSLWKEL